MKLPGHQRDPHRERHIGPQKDRHKRLKCRLEVRNIGAIISNTRSTIVSGDEP
jgi:hypothetical protein